mmetsp:Transcript_16625/g.20717  ORF Transcript_16625/g.20717 Transcript_16625/m.20717 type:complete len:598 (-) Transcript_16625:137-1930(-)
MLDTIIPTTADTPTTTTNTPLQILCCLCSTPIIANPSNTCATCLASKSDITRGISTENTLHQCRTCSRWHKSASKWISCELESRDLMSLCLSNISGLHKKSRTQRLVDASWVWTEPHSMRLKVRLTVQKEVNGGVILQQSFVVTFLVRNQQCVECQAEFRQGSWKNLVQVRQHVGHKRTFLFLEQLILKHGAHRGCLSIQTYRDGMDFYFPDKGKAGRFMSFLESTVPIKTKTSKKLISTDVKSNISNFKHTVLVEIPPVCKDDLLLLPAKTARALGNISRLVLVKNVSNLIHLIDPLSGQTASMSSDAYWRDPLRPVVTAARSRFTRFVVLGKEAVVSARRNVSRRATSKKNRMKLAKVTVAKEMDLGVNDVQLVENSHVGYLMKSGDVAVGYDLREIQLIGDEGDDLREAGQFPDVVLLRKVYGGGVEDENKRVWKLNRLEVEQVETNQKKNIEMDEVDEEDFMREVESDREMRGQMNLYKSDLLKKSNVDTMDVVKEDSNNVTDDDESDADDQQVRLDELLDTLALDEGPDAQKDAAMKEQFGDDILDGFIEEGERAAKDGINYVNKEESREVKEKDNATVFGKEFMNNEYKFI